MNIKYARLDICKYECTQELHTDAEYTSNILPSPAFAVFHFAAATPVVNNIWKGGMCEKHLSNTVSTNPKQDHK